MSELKDKKDKKGWWVMAWAKDKNGQDVWLDESGVLPPQTRRQLDDSAGAAWAKDKNGQDVWQDAAGVLPPQTRRQLDDSAVAAGSSVRFRPEEMNAPAQAGAPAMVQRPQPAERPAEASFAMPPERSAAADWVNRPGAPYALPPETVEGQRVPPVVEGVTMRRGAPGSGMYGENADFTPTPYRRDEPMTMRQAAEAGMFGSRVPKNVTMDPSDAYRAGLIDVYGGLPATPDGPQDMRAAQRINATPGMRAFDQEMRSEDAQAMRAGFRRESSARAEAAEMRATGRVGASKDIVARILGDRAADKASERKIREARMTPQVKDGAVYDPLTGRSEVPAKGGVVRPTSWEEYTPKELGDMVNETVRSMVPEGNSKAFSEALLTAKTDEEKQEVYKQFSARPTPAQQLILDTALEQLRGRGGSSAGGAAGKSGAAGGRKVDNWTRR